ncbi:recombination protein NinG [Yersinia enterocolitica]|uniref:recombination protein NinG n=1 Tax=Yersinia enterocolitica TaxID=630 RepID=UPI003CFC50ED
MIAKLPKHRNCKVCNERFKPDRVETWWCCPEHREEYCIILYRKDRERRQKKKSVADKQLAKTQKDELKARREKLKTKPQRMAEAQSAFNKYVRLKYLDTPCISCGRYPEQKYGGTMECGHYRSRGSAPNLRFNLHNTGSQCVYCNRHLSGNVAGFRIGLIERDGVDKVQEVDSNHETRKFDIPYLIRIKTIFTKKAKMLEKRRSHFQEVAA